MFTLHLIEVTFIAVLNPREHLSEVLDIVLQAHPITRTNFFGVLSELNLKRIVEDCNSDQSLLEKISPYVGYFITF